MPDHQADNRTLNFPGDIDGQGQPLPMTVEVLRARTEKWPQSLHAWAIACQYLSPKACGTLALGPHPRRPHDVSSTPQHDTCCSTRRLGGCR